MMSIDILVLEHPWSEELANGQSVKPFLDGWAAVNDFSISYRMYHDHNDLKLWLTKFVRDPKIKTCYIAGHGSGGRLCGLDNKDIYIGPVLSRATVLPKKGVPKVCDKGILFGACYVGGSLENILTNCGEKITWVAGYEIDVPWMESTICDLLFLQYKLRGRLRIDKNDEFYRDANDDYKRTGTVSANKAASWINEDYPVSVRCHFTALDR
jgi:hypothetical protein